VVISDRAYASPISTRTHELVCVDMISRRVLWRMPTGEEWSDDGLWKLSDTEILSEVTNGVVIADVSTRQVRKRPELKGRVFGVDSERKVYTVESPYCRLRRYDPVLSTEDWSCTLDANTNSFPRLVKLYGGVIFVCLVPRTYLQSDDEYSWHGQRRTVCLMASDGEVVWRRDIIGRVTESGSVEFDPIAISGETPSWLVPISTMSGW